MDLLLLGSGAVVGIILFANLLSWLLKKYHDVTIAILVGFMIGSLNKIWPWKETLKTIVVDGEIKPLVEKNILPSLSSADDRFWMALLMAAAGIALILLIELVLAKKPEKLRLPINHYSPITTHYSLTWRSQCNPNQ